MSDRRYSMGAIVLHWLIAIAVIVNWRIAEAAEHAPEAEAGAIMSNHFALGITILVLTVLRLAWRLVKKPPPLASHLAPWEKALARVTHTAFYVLLIGLPLGGWFAMSSFGRGVPIWGLFDLPALPVPNDPATGEAVFEAHAAGGTIMLVLIALHILGSLKHMFVDKDGNLWRMLPFGTPKA